MNIIIVNWGDQSVMRRKFYVLVAQQKQCGYEGQYVYKLKRRNTRVNNSLSLSPLPAQAVALRVFEVLSS